MGGCLGFLVVVLFAIPSFAQIHCADLAEDLKSMQAAQKQLLHSLSQKNEMMAAVLNQNADKLEKKLSQRRALKRTDLRSLRISAKAFRGHEKRESALVARFEKASSELLEQVQACLTQKTTAKN